MTASELTRLIEKYLAEEATEKEKEIVEQWYESFDNPAVPFAEGDPRKINESMTKSLEAIKEKIAQAQAEKSANNMTFLRSWQKGLRWRKITAAAILLALITSGTAYFLLHESTKEPPASDAIQSIKKDFKPGGNKAILTLGNGTKILLDSTNSGLLSMQGGTKIIKINSGLLSYNAQEKTKNKKQETEVQDNTITTPRGGQYEVVLPDGSKAWLNAASSIRFPTVFRGKERAVRVTGEAYFEIAPNAGRPFKVSAGETTITVLGTHFNIKAYKDEDLVKTTLFKGSVKVSYKDHALLLAPGQEARVKQNGRMELIKDINIKEAVAWKNNLFWFNNTPVEEVMKQLSRWYDVDIVIKGDIPDQFTGSIPRTLTFSRVFEILRKTGSMHFTIQDKKIIVTP